MGAAVKPPNPCVLRIGISNTQVEVSMTAAVRSMPIFIVELPLKIINIVALMIVPLL
jgi:hypothetical protein